MAEDRSKPFDTVRLDAGASKRLMDDLDRASAAGAAKVKANRRGLRVGYRPGMVPIEVTQPSGDVTRYAVLPRNLSAWGLGFIHGRFVYPTSRVVVVLSKRDGQAAAIRGGVVHCRHLMGLLHEVALRFDAPIDLASYVELSPAAVQRALADAGVADAEPTQRGARVVVIGGDGCDVLAAELPAAGFAVRREDAATAGQSIAEGNLAAVILDAGENVDAAAELLAGWRQRGYAGAILVLMHGEDDQAEARVLEAGANAVLPPPHSAAEVLRWLGRLGEQEEPAAELARVQERTAEEAAGSAALPALWPNAQALRENLQSGDKGLMELIDAFTTSLNEQAQRLEAACDENDFETVMELCRAVEAAGASFGEERLTKACRWTLSVLAEQSGEVHVIRQSVRNLLAEMRRKIR